MIARCEDVNYDHYSDYGGRGIKVCPEWRMSYEAFLKDIGRAPSKTHSLDRINPDGNYCKENCKWATKMEQSRNKRNNINITHDGRTMILKDWASQYNLNYKSIHFLMKRKNYTFPKILEKYSLT